MSYEGNDLGYDLGYDSDGASSSAAETFVQVAYQPDGVEVRYEMQEVPPPGNWGPPPAGDTPPPPAPPPEAKDKKPKEKKAGEGKEPPPATLPPVVIDGSDEETPPNQPPLPPRDPSRYQGRPPTQAPVSDWERGLAINNLSPRAKPIMDALLEKFGNDEEGKYLASKYLEKHKAPDPRAHNYEEVQDKYLNDLKKVEAENFKSQVIEDIEADLRPSVALKLGSETRPMRKLVSPDKFFEIVTLPPPGEWLDLYQAHIQDAETNTLIPLMNRSIVHQHLTYFRDKGVPPKAAEQYLKEKELIASEATLPDEWPKDEFYPIITAKGFPDLPPEAPPEEQFEDFKKFHRNYEVLRAAKSDPSKEDQLLDRVLPVRMEVRGDEALLSKNGVRVGTYDLKDPGQLESAREKANELRGMGIKLPEDVEEKLREPEAPEQGEDDKQLEDNIPIPEGLDEEEAEIFAKNYSYYKQQLTAQAQEKGLLSSNAGSVGPVAKPSTPVAPGRAAEEFKPLEDGVAPDKRLEAVSQALQGRGIPAALAKDLAPQFYRDQGIDLENADAAAMKEVEPQIFEAIEEIPDDLTRDEIKDLPEYQSLVEHARQAFVEKAAGLLRAEDAEAAQKAYYGGGQGEERARKDAELFLADQDALEDYRKIARLQETVSKEQLAEFHKKVKPNAPVTRARTEAEMGAAMQQWARGQDGLNLETDDGRQAAAEQFGEHVNANPHLRQITQQSQNPERVRLEQKVAGTKGEATAGLTGKAAQEFAARKADRELDAELTAKENKRQERVRARETREQRDWEALQEINRNAFQMAMQAVQDHRQQKNAKEMAVLQSSLQNLGQMAQGSLQAINALTQQHIGVMWQQTGGLLQGMQAIHQTILQGLFGGVPR